MRVIITGGTGYGAFLMLEERDVLSPARVARFLELGCAYNTPISISSESRKKTHRYKSRMLDIRKASNANIIIIDQPVADLRILGRNEPIIQEYLRHNILLVKRSMDYYKGQSGQKTEKKPIKTYEGDSGRKKGD